MPFPERSPYVRTLPGAHSLDLILKNTHFPDELLAPEAPLRCTLQWNGLVPTLVVSFHLPSYDFSEPLLHEELKNTTRGWLLQPTLKIRLLLADNVIADRVTERVFTLSESDSRRLKDIFS